MSYNLCKKEWFVCEEHLEMILDDIVDYHAIAPSLELWDNRTDSSQFPEACCEKCGSSPDYILTYLEDRTGCDADSSNHSR